MSKPEKFRTKPTEIEAMGPVDLLGDWSAVNEIREWCGGRWWRSEERMGYPPHYFQVPTREGNLQADTGDWIIRYPEGGFYLLPSDIFESQYEPSGRPEGDAA